MHPFINRLLCFMLAIALVVALAVPVFAATTHSYNGVELPPLPEFSESDNLMIAKNPDTGEYSLFHFSSGTIYYTDGGLYGSDGFGSSVPYKLEDGSWTVSDGFAYFKTGEIYPSFIPIWSSFDIHHKDGGLFFAASEPVVTDVCDGSSCPATDANHDNICDDCGKVLAYNLRSTLLDFAKAHAATFSYQKYFAVFQHPSEDNKYNVFLSSTPMYANSPDYTTAYGTDMLWLQVWENADGTHSYSGEITVYKMTDDPDNLVYANHTIENFTAPPLAVKIQGVSGEALMMELPNLIAEAKIIVICGVGCLALLIVLPILSKKLKPFLTR